MYFLFSLIKRTFKKNVNFFHGRLRMINIYYTRRLHFMNLNEHPLINVYIDVNQNRTSKQN